MKKDEAGSDLVAITVALKEFSVSKATLFRYLASGELKRYRRRMDRKTYVDRRAIKRLLRPQVVKGVKE